MPKRARGQDTLAADQILWLSGALTLVLLPHVPRVPFWVTVTFALSVLWRVAGAAGKAALPGRGINVFLGLTVMAAVFLTYGSVLGRNPGITMLVGLSGLKLLETRSSRDAFASVLLAYFLVITNFLTSQSIPTGIYMLLSVIVVTAALVGLNSQSREIPTRERLSLATAMVLQAIPLSLLLFVLFPRISGPLWGLPEDAHGGVTGLGDSMSPGAISRLSQSEGVAFRVEFDGFPPPPAERYWRGPVLWNTDGRTWQATELADSPPPPLPRRGRQVEYAVTLEPHDQRWLFLLDIPNRLPDDATLMADYRVLTRKPVRERIRYQASSTTSANPVLITDQQYRLALSLPPTSHPKARALARRWRESARTPQDLVNRALEHFREGEFYYTLTPPLLLDDPVDQFLFETRQGFCEHYASSFAVLMRAAGVPTRVVTGYQGGEINPIDDYLVVRHRDAHAWAEVWLGEQGWLRVDPTAAVSPERIESGMESALPRPVAPLIGLALQDGSPLYELWRSARFGWDAVNNWWNQWVLGYGPSRQSELLSRFGMDGHNWQHLAVGLGLTTTTSFLAVALWLRWRQRVQPDRVTVVYERFCKKLAHWHLMRSPSEGPWDFASRASIRLPRMRRQIHEITRSYVRLRYGRDGGDLSELRRLVSRFRP